MIKIKKPSKKILTTLVIVLIIGAAAALLIYRNSINNSEQTATLAAGTETINYDPPTEEDAKSVEENKQRITDQEQERLKNQQSSTGKAVKPTINFAEQNGSEISIGSFVPGIFEDGGTCTVELTNGSDKVTKNVGAVKEGNATYCPTFIISSSEFAKKGVWTVYVSYNSSLSSGKSDGVSIEIR